jgi:hypothetical protein
LIGNAGEFQPVPSGFGNFGFQSESTGFGAGQPVWAFSGTNPGGDDGEDYLDDEERERVEAVIQANEERKRQLFTKQEQEDIQKRERKAKGREDLLKWQGGRSKQIALRKKTNAD